MIERWARPLRGLSNGIAGAVDGVYRVLGRPGKLLQDFLSAITPQYWPYWLGLFLVVLVLVGRDRLLKPWTWFGRGRAA